KIVILLAVLFWAAGTYANAAIQFTVGDINFRGEVSSVFGTLLPYVALSRVLAPLGSLMLIYAVLTGRSKLAMVLLAITVVGDFGAGFFENSKETAFRVPLLFVFSSMLLREKFPIIAVIVVSVLGGLTFDLFASYRDYIGTRGVTNAQVVESFD